MMERTRRLLSHTDPTLASSSRLCYATPRLPAPAVLHRLTIGQKLLLGFGALLTLLALSLAGLLFYLSRVNSYVDRHQRITIPGVVTASEIQQTVSHMQTQVHHLLEHQPASERTASLGRLADMEAQVAEALTLYRENHAARRHPILHSMLVAHGRTDLVEEENRDMAAITDRVRELEAIRLRLVPALESSASDRRALDALEIEYERAVAAIESAVRALVEVHRKIDIEMKLEGDRLVAEARTIALGLAVLFGLVILSVFLTMKHLVARPLERLAATADRVAHHDLTVQFEPWPTADEVGRLAGSLSTMLTNLRDRGTALMRKTKELEAFTYSVAHDIKGPLREIEGFSSLLEKRFADAQDADVRHHLDVIRRSALRLTAMIDALLKYSRLEQQTLPLSRFNLGEMVAHLVTERQQDLHDRKPKILVELPVADLYGEPVSVRQALHNLLDNAVKFSRRSPHPEVVIGGSRAPDETIVWIKDNGIGIDPKDQERMFGLFERLHPAGEYEGTGVGLAIVKLVMDKHRGRVWVQSSPGAGTTFYLAFPERAA